MDNERILELILNIGAAMIRSGAETHRVEDSLYRICDSYGFTDCNIWVVPSNIQATITDGTGRRLTQIRHIRGISVDFARLDRLNNLSREICVNTPDAVGLARRFAAATEVKLEPVWVNYLAGVLAAAGFGIFFNCDLMDAAAAMLAALIITFFGRRLSAREHNPLVLNFVISFATELFILTAVHFGLGHHSGCITVSVVMLMISALGTTNGVRDLIHLDTLSGTMNITSSFTGAIGIALGIALPLRLLSGWSSGDMGSLTPYPLVGLLSCAVGCVGFALWFHVKRSHVTFCAVGAFLTWGAYLLSRAVTYDMFPAVIISSAVCAFYAQVVARIKKAPATIFMTVSVFPLIPGSALYYTMYGAVTGDKALAVQKGVELALTCVSIVLGFMAVEVASRYIWKERRDWRSTDAD